MDEQVEEQVKKDQIAEECDKAVNAILNEKDVQEDDKQEEESADTECGKVAENTSIDKEIIQENQEEFSKTITQKDIEELAEAISDIRDKAAAIENDQRSFIQGTQQHFKDIDNAISSLMLSLKEVTELPEQFSELSQSLVQVNNNINSTVTNLQGALNQINDGTNKCIQNLQYAADDIPKKLLENCNEQNKKALGVAVDNFNAMNIASQKWLKKLGNNTDSATQIVIVSGILTPILVLLAIVYLVFKL